ncbi:MAG: SDR family oxidoreductase [Sandaracinaceae bacterium]
MTPRHVLIAGFGYVGRALGQELAAAGHRVVGLRRSKAPVPPGVEALRADLLDPSTLTVPSEVDAVVYAVSPAERSESAYRAAYVEGPANLARALRAAGAPVERLLFVSSTAVYGQDDGSWVDERSPTEPATPTARVLLDGEQAAQELGFRTTVLRLAGIYGPDRTWLVRRVEAGEVRVEGPDHVGPPRYGNRIHRRDCAGALAHLLTHPDPPPTLIGVDDDPAPLAEVYRFVAERLGVPAPPAGEVGRGRGGNKRCRNGELRRTGYALRVPSYREGYPEVIDRMIRH